MEFAISYYPGGGLRLKSKDGEARLNGAQAKRFYSGLSMLTRISGKKPQSIYALATELGIDVSNLRKTLRLYTRLGLVEMSDVMHGKRRAKAPRLLASRLKIDLSSLEAGKEGRRGGLVRRRRP